MLTGSTSASTVSNVVSLDTQLLDAGAAVDYIRATVGVPLSTTDLESDISAGRGPIHRKWGRQRLFRRSDLTAWATDRLSAPIHPRRAAR
jgi:hypothetical protein